MLAHSTYPGRQENPLGLTVILASAALATVGVVGVAAGARARKLRIDEENAKPPGGMDGLTIAGFVGVQQGGGPGSGTPPSLEEDAQTMRTNGLFTAFFTSEVEQEVISRMQAFKNKHKIEPGDCKPVVGTIMESGGLGYVQYRKYFDRGAQATIEILTDLYPPGAPWDKAISGVHTAEEAEEGGVLLGAVGLWRWWLWNRVIGISDFQVCGFKPVT